MTTERWAIHLHKENFKFSCAHFLIFPDGSKERLHGHNYYVDAEIEGLLTDKGIVIDFIQVNALSGALLAFPAVTGLNVAPGSRGNYINADGGVVDLSAVTAFRGASAGFSLCVPRQTARHAVTRCAQAESG